MAGWLASLAGRERGVKEQWPVTLPTGITSVNRHAGANQAEPERCRGLGHKALFRLHLKAETCFNRMIANTRSLNVPFGTEMSALLQSSIENIHCIFHWCRRERNLAFDLHFYAYVCDQGLDASFGNKFVSFFVDAGCVGLAQQVFDRLPYQDEMSWNSLITGYVEEEHFNGALALYTMMQDSDALHLNNCALLALLKACAALEDLGRGQSVHSQINSNVWKGDVYSSSAVINMYVKCGHLSKAKEVFDSVFVRNVVSWNAIMAGYVEYGQPELALTFLKQMELEGISPDTVTFSCSLKACGTVESIAEGHRVHADTARKGLDKDISVANTLIKMYAKCGSLLEAESIFHVLPVRTAVSWTSVLSGFVENGHPEAALEYFEDMRVEGMVIDAFTLASVLKACCCVGSLIKGYKVHADIARRGFAEADAFIGSALVRMYAACLSLTEAQEIFDKLLIKTIVTWNALMTGYMEYGDGKRVLGCFNQMQLERVSADAVTLVCILKACGRIQEKFEGHAIHQKIIEQALHDTYNLIDSSLVDMYASYGMLDEACCVFENLRFKTSVTYNMLLAGYVQYERHDQALKFYEQIQREGRNRDAATFIWALKACANLSDVLKGQEIHAEIICKGLESDESIGNTLVDTYAKCGLFDEVQSMFDALCTPCVISWTTLIKGYMKREDTITSLRLFDQMMHTGICLDAPALVCALRACSSVVKCHELHAIVIKVGLLEVDVIICNALIHMYVKIGLLSEAQNILNKLPVRTTVSWTMLITGYVECGNDENALSCYVRMQNECVPADVVTLLCWLASCGSLTSIMQGQKMHCEAVRKGFDRDLMVGNALIDMYSKCGVPASAKAIFKKLEILDVVSWNALISGYAQIGECENVFKLVHKMIGADIKPDRVTLGSILSCCSHTGLLDQSQRCFEEISYDYGLIPTIEHYNCLADTFGRAGYIEKAMAIIEHMPCHPNIVMWHAVLGSCQKEGNVDFGRGAFEHAMQLSESDSATYICMSNIYVNSIGAWN